ncbi:MAG: phosphoenolpyruvate--protein phosphotransferase [Leptospirales bacterium]|nr:phosphoenolpyruvate--protein phosphotransferase [Leptospirales bacterium]
MNKLIGTTAARGIARGLVRILPTLSHAVPNIPVDPEKVTDELAALEKARRQSIHQIQELLDETDLPAEHREIFESQILLLDDPMLFEAARTKIVQESRNAAGSLAEVLEELKAQFSRVADSLFRERIADLEDIAQRVLSNLLGLSSGDPRLPFLRSLPSDAILVADDIPPSLMLHIRNISGIVVHQGGVTGHMAILARDRGIPAIVAVDELLETARDGMPAILNATDGFLLLEPDDAALRKYRDAIRTEDATVVTSPVSLPNGDQARIWVNLDDPEDALSTRICGIQGIGLFRTEFIFYKYPELFDSPDDHCDVYRKVFGALQGKPVTCRLLDVGDDKTLPASMNRYLDADKQDAILRGVKFLLSHPGLLTLQLRALIEAALDIKMPTENLRILLPLVSTRGEILAFRQFYDHVRSEIEKERGIQCPQYPVGIMMETPAACIMADVLSRYVEFFSLGTNDLAGLTLAFHRSGPSEDPFFQPSMFRMIQTGLSKATVPVSICGEMGGIPEIVPVLFALGVHDFSVSISSLQYVEQALKAYDPQKTADKLERILRAQNREEVRLILQS